MNHGKDREPRRNHGKQRYCFTTLDTQSTQESKRNFENTQVYLSVLLLWISSAFIKIACLSLQQYQSPQIGVIHFIYLYYYFGDIYKFIMSCINIGGYFHPYVLYPRDMHSCYILTRPTWYDPLLDFTICSVSFCRISCNLQKSPACFFIPYRTVLGFIIH